VETFFTKRMPDTPDTLISYDDLPYESLPLPDTHPDYLRALARLYGVDAAPMASCRVLELGCAGGGNLLPLAWHFPASRCVGVELARGHVDEAKALIAELSLNNAQVLHRSITDPIDDLGEFDYIIAHGVFSWVPRAVQERLLEICGRHLAANGVAYISYNTLPGWHVRGLLRDALLAYCSPSGRASERLAQAHALFDLIEPALRAQSSLDAQLALKEIAYLRRAAPSYVYHEYLEEINEPLHFSTFMQRAAQAGLAYLADAEPWTMFPDTLGADAAVAFAAIPQRLQQEQMLDLARLRKFRRSLLVRSDVKVRTTPDLAALETLAYFADLSSTEEIDLGSTSAQDFSGPSGSNYSASQPLTKAALMLLAMHYPQALSWDALQRRAAALLVEHGGRLDDGAMDAYRTELFSLIAYQAVRPTLEIGASVDTLAERPCAHALARAQAARGRIVASVRHGAVELDALGATLLMHLDGTRSLHELVAFMADALEQEEQAIDPALLENACVQMLWTFARQGLLADYFDYRLNPM
jgi:SAM-dependent methyltransferase